MCYGGVLERHYAGRPRVLYYTKTHDLECSVVNIIVEGPELPLTSRMYGNCVSLGGNIYMNQDFFQRISNVRVNYLAERGSGPF